MSGRTDAPGPNRRRGPRPLLFHLSQAMLRSAPDGRTPSESPAQGGHRQAGHPPTDHIQTGRPRTDHHQAGLPQTGQQQRMQQSGQPQAGQTHAGQQQPMGQQHPERPHAGQPETGQPETGQPPMDGSSDWPPAWPSWSESWPGTAAWDPAACGADAPPPMPDAALLAGIAAYRRHPYERRVAEPPCLWAEGGSRLLDYGPAGAPPVLFVPSLVNRAYVLDLHEQHSMLRFLAAGGVRPLLLDWGWPDTAARSFTLTDYIAGRLERALAAVGTPVTLAGYCMGGLMAVASAARRPDLVTRLVLLATPWDFWARDGSAARSLGAWLPLLEPVLALGTLPVDALQVLFSLAEPGSVAAKYRAFGAQDQQGSRAAMFVAIEDWLSDGVPLAAPVAREVIAGWYGANTPARGVWRCAGLEVRPPRLPSFIAVPGRDRIVPPGSALALAAAMPDAVVVRPQAGHVGMVAGSNARSALWKPLLAWLHG